MTRANLPGIAIFLAGVGLIWAFLLAPNYPGIMTADSIDMLCQAIRNRYHDWHSPAMSLIWRGLGFIAPGPAPMLVFIQAAYLLGAGFLAFQLSPHYPGRLALLALLVLWPPLCSVLGSVTKDSMYIWVYLLFLGLLLRTVLQPRITPGSIATLLALTVLGAAFRTDGMVLFLPALIYVFYLAWSEKRAGVATFVKAAVAGFAAVLICMGLVTAFNSYVMRVTPRFNIQMTLYYDITGISVRAGQDLMPDYLQRQGFDLAFLRERYHPGFINHLTWTSGANRNVPVTSDPAEFQQLKQAWLQAVGTHPLYYLEQRAAFLTYQVDFRRHPDLPIFLTQTDSNYREQCPPLQGLDLMVPETAIHQLVVQQILPALVRTPIFRGYIYSIIMLLEIGWAFFRLRRGRKPSTPRLDRLIVTLGAGALLHQLALVFVSAGGLFRYLYPGILTCLVMTLLSFYRVRLARSGAA